MIFRSPYPDVGIPEVPFPQFLLRRATELGDQPALIDAPTQPTLTYGELADSVGRVAANLTARGLHRGDVFAIMTPNLPEFAIAFLGVLSKEQTLVEAYRFQPVTSWPCARRTMDFRIL
jgi:acyl-CoA synthetase (AMP-forming)/AMP-acid ligase II